jgi:hypothetical protein
MPDTDETPDSQELPGDIVSEAERLTRLAREAVDDNEARAYREARADLLADYDFEARVREESRDTLVLYPSEWVVDGTVHPDRIEDIDRGIERPLEGPGEAEEWETIAEHNNEIAQAVAEEHGEVHGGNAHAMADFASNHYAKPIGDLTREEREEFLTEYFPRNAFPSDDQKAIVEESVRLVLDAVENVTDAGR